MLLNKLLTKFDGTINTAVSYGELILIVVEQSFTRLIERLLQQLVINELV